MNENKKESKVKELFNKIKEVILKNKKLSLIIGGVVIVLIIVLIVLLAIPKDDNNGGSSSGNKPGENPGGSEEYPEGGLVADEDSIKDEYGFSKQDAINVVKKIYNSDNYEFSAEARRDNMYVVTVTNSLTKEKTIYVVDPNDGTFMLENE